MKASWSFLPLAKRNRSDAGERNLAPDDRRQRLFFRVAPADVAPAHLASIQLHGELQHVFYVRLFRFFKKKVQHIEKCTAMRVRS